MQKLSELTLARGAGWKKGTVARVLSIDVQPDRRKDAELRRESRADFWNRIELHHKRGDATTSREVEVALPVELNKTQRRELAEQLGQALADRYQVAADVSVHEKEGNPHAHILLSACSIFPDGQLGKKVAELDPIHCERHKIKNLADEFRPKWEQMCNQALLKAGHRHVRVDHRAARITRCFQ